MVWLLSIFALASVALVRATAVKDKPQDIIPLSPDQINEITLFARFASTAYCNRSTIRHWNCGGVFAHCPTLEARLVENDAPTAICQLSDGGFSLIEDGGDGIDTPYCRRTIYE
jgi:hypothetical protein